MSLRTHTAMEGKKMKYEDCNTMVLDLSSIGGNHPYTLEELVHEVVCHRRNRFINTLFNKASDKKDSFGGMCFDSIGFIAATKDFDTHVATNDFEGELIYDVIAGGDWVWHCKTTITWRSALPIAGGFLCYHTDVIPGENVKTNCIAAMTGTSMEIKIVKNNLNPITFMEALKRDGIIK